MTPPLFVWKSGVLDVFDSAADLAERYATDELSGEGVVCCDAEGRTLRAYTGPDGTTAHRLRRRPIAAVRAVGRTTASLS